MKANKRSNTKPELLVRKRLREAGLTGYRLHWKVPGSPDIAWCREEGSTLHQWLFLASMPALQSSYA